MKKPLWTPSVERIRNTRMTRFTGFVNEWCRRTFSHYFDLHDWSVSNIPDFWPALWDFLEIKASGRYDKVVEDLSISTSRARSHLRGSRHSLCLQRQEGG